MKYSGLRTGELICSFSGSISRPLEYKHLKHISTGETSNINLPIESAVQYLLEKTLFI